MLYSNPDLADSVFHELLRMDKLGLVLVFIVSCAKHIVLAQAPGINLVTLLAECIVVMTHGPHL